MESLGSVAMVVEGVATATKVVEEDLQGLQNMVLDRKTKMQFHPRDDLVLNCQSF